MTPEECERMNLLCAAIQEEKNYDKFAALLRELAELIERKEQRRFKDQPKLTWHRRRPWKTVPGVVNKIVKPAIPKQTEKVEISIGAADHLFREVRLENALTDIDGQSVALTDGAHVDVTFEADAKDTVRRLPQIT
jgi:hypothetical protein